MLTEEQLQEAENIASHMLPSWEKAKIVTFTHHIRTLQQQNETLKKALDRAMKENQSPDCFREVSRIIRGEKS